MKQLNPTQWTIEFRIGIGYFLIALLWITISDVLMQGFAPTNVLTSAVIHVVKGMIFVIATAIGLFALVRYEMRYRASVKNKLIVENSRLSWLMQQMPLIFWMTDTQLRISNISSSPSRIVSLKTHQTLLQHAQLQAAYRAALNGLETHFDVAVDGYTFDVRVAPLHDLSNRIVGTIGTAIDISAQRQAQETLILSESRFETLVNSMDDIVFTLDTQQRHTGVYGRWLAANNTPESFFIGRTSREILGDDTAEVHERANDEALCGKSVMYEWQLDNGDEVSHMQTRLSPLRDASGQVIGLVGVGRDITPTKQLEEQLSRTNHQLEQWVEERTADLLRANAALERQIIAKEKLQMLEFQQRRLAEAMRDGIAAISSTLDIDKVLDRLMASIGRVIPHDSLNIMICKDNEAFIVRSLDMQLNGKSWMLHDSLTLKQISYTHQPILRRVCSLESNIPTEPRPNTTRSFICAPILIDHEIVGFINLSSDTPNQYCEEHLNVLKIFVDQVSIVIQNTQLYQQAARVAVHEERQRFARDLHDAVSQTLFSASVISETLLNAKDYKAEQIQQAIVQLHRLTRGALAEMRTLLLELRPTALVDTDLITLIHQLVEAFYSRTNIVITCDIDEDITVEDDLRKIAVYRIIQEALNNIVKHARASQVGISLRRHDKTIMMQICDDGYGFDPKKTLTGDHMGLLIMQERAREIKATYAIRSKQGKGTTIELSWEQNNE